MLRPFASRFHSERFVLLQSDVLHEVSAGQDMYINLARVVEDVSASMAVNNGFALSKDWGVFYRAAELGRTWDQWCVIDYIMHTTKPRYQGLVPVAYHILLMARVIVPKIRLRGRLWSSSKTSAP